MGITKLMVAALVAVGISGTASVGAREFCGGHRDGYLHLRIAPAQTLYDVREDIKINAEVVRRLPTGDIPVEGAEVYTSLHQTRHVGFDRGVTDVDGQAVLRIRSSRIVPGLVDALGHVEVTYTDLHYCVNPSHRDTVTREDFVRIVK